MIPRNVIAGKSSLNADGTVAGRPKAIGYRERERERERDNNLAEHQKTVAIHACR